MKRPLLLLLLLACGAALAWFLVHEQQAAQVDIGVIQFTSNNLQTLEGFQQGLAALDEERQVNYLFDGPAPSLQKIHPYIAKLLEQEPDLIFASTTPAAIAAKELAAPQGIPVVFAPVNDPVSSGVVLSPQQPEGNVTGVRLSPSEGRRLQALHDLAPACSRVFVPYNPEDPSAKATLQQLQTAAPPMNVVVSHKPFLKDSDPSAPGYVPQDADAIFLPREGRVMSRYRDFIKVAEARRLPMSTPRVEQVEEGVLTGYGFVGFEIGKQAARLAHLMLQGTPASSLPVETAQDYLFINLAAAEGIGLTVPDAILRRAHFIFREAP